jgi:hypothetical protein
MSKTSTAIIVLLLIIIGILAWLAFGKPVAAPVTTTTPTSTPAQEEAPASTETPTVKPLHEKITVTSPKANAAVGKKFTISGKAPGNWFFEASAPYLVTTPDGDKIAQGTLHAIGDWMTTNLVDFKAEASVNMAYSGPATLVLLRDNPSGMPENDDSLEVPITIQ